MEYTIVDPSWALTKRPTGVSIPIRLFCKKPEGSIVIKERYLNELESGGFMDMDEELQVP